MPPIQAITNYTTTAQFQKKKWGKGKKQKKTSSFLAISRDKRENNFVSKIKTLFKNYFSLLKFH